MKLNVVAIAVAASFALPVVAHAESSLKISGDITAFYQDSLEDITLGSSEVNVDATQGNFFGHAEIDFGDNGANPTVEELRIGVKLGTGQLIIGENDNACDSFDPGTPDNVLSAGTGGGCVSTDVNNIIYKGKTGATEYAVSYNLDTGDAADSAPQTSIGARHTFGSTKVNLGFVDNDGESNVHAGIETSFGPVTLAAEANDNENAEDVAYGIYAKYVANGNTVWGAVDDGGDATIGYARVVNDKTIFFLEADMLDEENEAGEDSDFAVGLKMDF